MGGGSGRLYIHNPQTWLVLLFFCFSLICNCSCYSEGYNTCLLEAAQSITSGEGEKDITAGVSSYITSSLLDNLLIYYSIQLYLCFTPDARGTEYYNSLPAGIEFQNDHECEARGIHFSLGPSA